MRSLWALLALTLPLALGGCAPVDEAASFEEFEELEEDSDGVEEDAVEFRMDPFVDTCGDEPDGGGPPLCAQQCHDTYHDVCVPAAHNTFDSNCLSEAEHHSGSVNCEDDLVCLLYYDDCLSGDWLPEIEQIRNNMLANCQTARIGCLADC